MRPTERFTSRVESYRLHRPGYPKEIVALLESECGLMRDSVIADVAAGTGLLSEIFLASGYAVLAVEPNDAMREACLSLTEEFSKLSCVAGTAEATGLSDGSVNLVTVAQAMHWFDLKRTRAEFVRILAPGGYCVVIYNNRRMRGDAFHDGYEKILKDFGSDYEVVQSSHLTEDRLATFFSPAAMQTATLPNHQDLTLEGLTGRIVSSSYMPQEGGPKYTVMSDAITELFKRNAKGGVVRMEYETVLCFGVLSPTQAKSA